MPMRRVFCDVASKPGLIATLTLNPTLDDAVEVDALLPDDVSAARNVRLDPGGKGINVSRTLVRLRSPTIAYAPVGGWSGQRLVELLDAEHVAHCFTTVTGETRVNLIITTADHTQYRVKYPGPPLGLDDITLLLADMAALDPKPVYWVLGGSLPPGAPVNTYAVAIQQAHRQGIPVILDADEEPLKLGVQASPYLIKPNRHELGRLVGRELCHRQDYLDAARSLIDTHGIHIVLLSLGAEGALAVNRQEAWSLVPPPVTPVSQVGAGDATVAGMAKALAAGESLVSAGRYAVAVGTAKVLSPGTVLTRPEEVQRLLPLIRVEKLEVPVARTA
jgi:1-phosphofructokinase family hexose kinase